MKSKVSAAVAGACVLALSGVTSARADYVFTTLDGLPSGPHGAGTNEAQAYGINNQGQIVGLYVDSAGAHGFLKSNGTYSTLNASTGTRPYGINDAGQIAGEYISSSGVNAFVYSNGTFTILGAPFGTNTYYASGINNSGQVVGIYFGAPQGFIYNNGTYTSLPFYLNGYNQITGINNSGQIVGSTYLGIEPHGFVYKDGVYTALNDPLGVNGTAAVGINNSGQIVGYYLDSNNVQHGYLYSNGTYVTLDDPLGSRGTVATGINDSGQIVGFYLDGSGPFPPVWESSATTKMASTTLSSLRPSLSPAPSLVLAFLA